MGKKNHSSRHRRGSADLGYMFGSAADRVDSRNSGVSRSGQRDRLESDIDNAARSSGFAARLLAGKRDGVPMAQRWLRVAAGRDSPGVFGALQYPGVSCWQDYLRTAV